ncbi:MAG: hypothetical protein KC516_03595 [Nanoarchaeota archaeon]|nr:hypothetical protein [Nanoarchaeota archaeon]
MKSAEDLLIPADVSELGDFLRKIGKSPEEMSAELMKEEILEYAQPLSSDLKIISRNKSLKIYLTDCKSVTASERYENVINLNKMGLEYIKKWHSGRKYLGKENAR